MIYLSPHCTYKEAIHSKVAASVGVDNTPNEKQLANIKELLLFVFEPLRVWANTALYISSLFRSEVLNNIIGGANSSQHLCNKGAAMDIDADVYGGITNNELFFYIKDNLLFDQLILEDIDESGNGAWVHVSYRADSNRKDVLLMKRIKKGNKLITTYVPYEEPIESPSGEPKTNEDCHDGNGD